MPIPPPTYEGVAEPPSEDIPVSYQEFSGLRGCSGQTHLLQSDGPTNPGIAIQATGNIYLDASARMQQSSDVCVQSVGNRLLQYITDIEKHVSGQVFEHIEGPSTFKVNTDHTVEVVGNHTLNVATAQETSIGAGQTVNITGNQNITVDGNQTLTVTGSIVETVNGDETRNVTGNGNTITNGEVKGTTLGGLFNTKASWEQSLTMSEKINICLSAEASATIGGSEKVTIGQHNEQFLGVKTSILAGSNITMGPNEKKQQTLKQVAVAAKDDVKAGMMKAKSGICSGSHKLYNIATNLLNIK